MDWETLVVGLLAVYGGYHLRLREVIRGERQATYVRFLQAIDSFPRTMLSDSLYPTKEERFRAFDAAAAEMAETEVELSILSSRRTYDRARALRNAIQDAYSDPKLDTFLQADDFQPFTDELFARTKDARDALVESMRRDIRVRPLDKGSVFSRPGALLTAA